MAITNRRRIDPQRQACLDAPADGHGPSEGDGGEDEHDGQHQGRAERHPYRVEEGRPHLPPHLEEQRAMPRGRGEGVGSTSPCRSWPFSSPNSSWPISCLLSYRIAATHRLPIPTSLSRCSPLSLAPHRPVSSSLPDHHLIITHHLPHTHPPPWPAEASPPPPHRHPPPTHTHLLRPLKQNAPPSLPGPLKHLPPLLTATHYLPTHHLPPTSFARCRRDRVRSAVRKLGGKL